MKRTSCACELLWSCFRVEALLPLLVMGLVCDASAGATSLRLNSEPGDYVGGGQQLFLTRSNGTFTGTHNFSNFVNITFGGPEHNFSLNFAAPQGQVLTVGTYEGARRSPSLTAPQMDVWGDGRGCNVQAGRFEVKQASYGNPFKFWATFEQHCEGAAPALFGEIRYNADVPVVVTAPSSMSVTEGGTLSFVVSATELQNRRVTLTASNVPAGASFVDNSDNTGRFSWTPGVGRAGVYDVTFRADNGLGASDEVTTRIAVTIPGDDFANAMQITGLPYTNTMDTTAATSANDDPYFCTFPKNTVWYVFTPATAMRIQATTAGSDYNTALSAYTGLRDDLMLVDCNDNSDGLQSELVFDVVAGRTYYFMVGVSGGEPAGNLVFALDALVPPPNDEITTATTITALPYTNVVDTTGAIVAQDDPNACGYYEHTVWYSFTASVTMRVEASTAGSDYRAGLAVFTGTRGALNFVGCGESVNESYSQFTFNAASGRRYYFMIAGPGGHLKFSVTPILPPTNDDFDRATVLTSLPFADAINTSLATTNRDDPTTCNQPGATVWYSFTPSQDLFIEANAEASDYSVVLSVWTGSRTALAQVACFGGDYVRFPAFAGTTYFIMAGSTFRGEGSHLVLTVNGRPKLKIGVTVEADAGADSKIGAATIQGTVTCSQPVTINVSGLLRQTVGRFHVIAGAFGSEYYFPGGPEPILVRCNGQTPWSARVFSDDGSFGGGHAFVEASAIAFVDNDVATAETEGTIHLSGSTKVRLDVDQAQLLSVGESANGTVLVQSLSVMSRTNVLQVSANLRDWTPVATNVPVSNPFDWVDTDKRTHPQRFYRVVTLP